MSGTRGKHNQSNKRINKNKTPQLTQLITKPIKQQTPDEILKEFNIELNDLISLKKAINKSSYLNNAKTFLNDYGYIISLPREKKDLPSYYDHVLNALYDEYAYFIRTASTSASLLSIDKLPLLEDPYKRISVGNKSTLLKLYIEYAKNFSEPYYLFYAADQYALLIKQDKTFQKFFENQIMCCHILYILIGLGSNHLNAIEEWEKYKKSLQKNTVAEKLHYLFSHFLDQEKYQKPLSQIYCLIEESIFYFEKYQNEYSDHNEQYIQYRERIELSELDKKPSSSLVNETDCLKAIAKLNIDLEREPNTYSKLRSLYIFKQKYLYTLESQIQTKLSGSSTPEIPPPNPLILTQSINTIGAAIFENIAIQKILGSPKEYLEHLLTALYDVSTIEFRLLNALNPIKYKNKMTSTQKKVLQLTALTGMHYYVKAIALKHMANSYCTIETIGSLENDTLLDIQKLLKEAIHYFKKIDVNDTNYNMSVLHINLTLRFYFLCLAHLKNENNPFQTIDKQKLLIIYQSYSILSTGTPQESTHQLIHFLTDTICNKPLHMIDLEKELIPFIQSIQPEIKNLLLDEENSSSLGKELYKKIEVDFEILKGFIKSIHEYNSNFNMSIRKNTDKKQLLEFDKHLEDTIGKHEDKIYLNRLIAELYFKRSEFYQILSINNKNNKAYQSNMIQFLEKAISLYPPILYYNRSITEQLKICTTSKHFYELIPELKKLVDDYIAETKPRKTKNPTKEVSIDEYLINFINSFFSFFSMNFDKKKIPSLTIILPSNVESTTLTVNHYLVSLFVLDEPHLLINFSNMILEFFEITLKKKNDQLHQSLTKIIYSHLLNSFLKIILNHESVEKFGNLEKIHYCQLFINAQKYILKSDEHQINLIQIYQILFNLLIEESQTSEAIKWINIGIKEHDSIDLIRAKLLAVKKSHRKMTIMLQKNLSIQKTPSLPSLPNDAPIELKKCLNTLKEKLNNINKQVEPINSKTNLLRNIYESNSKKDFFDQMDLADKNEAVLRNYHQQFTATHDNYFCSLRTAINELIILYIVYNENCLDYEKELNSIDKKYMYIIELIHLHKTQITQLNTLNAAHQKYEAANQALVLALQAETKVLSQPEITRAKEKSQSALQSLTAAKLAEEKAYIQYQAMVEEESKQLALSKEMKEKETEALQKLIDIKNQINSTQLQIDTYITNDRKEKIKETINQSTEAIKLAQKAILESTMACQAASERMEKASQELSLHHAITQSSIIEINALKNFLEVYDLSSLSNDIYYYCNEETEKIKKLTLLDKNISDKENKLINIYNELFHINNNIIQLNEKLLRILPLIQLRSLYINQAYAELIQINNQLIQSNAELLAIECKINESHNQLLKSIDESIDLNNELLAINQELIQSNNELIFLEKKRISRETLLNICGNTYPTMSEIECLYNVNKYVSSLDTQFKLTGSYTTRLVFLLKQNPDIAKRYSINDLDGVIAYNKNVNMRAIANTLINEYYFRIKHKEKDRINLYKTLKSGYISFTLEITVELAPQNINRFLPHQWCHAEFIDLSESEYIKALQSKLIAPLGPYFLQLVINDQHRPLVINNHQYSLIEEFYDLKGIFAAFPQPHLDGYCYSLYKAMYKLFQINPSLIENDINVATDEYYRVASMTIKDRLMPFFEANLSAGLDWNYYEMIKFVRKGLYYGADSLCKPFFEAFFQTLISFYAKMNNYVYDENELLQDNIQAVVHFISAIELGHLKILSDQKVIDALKKIAFDIYQNRMQIALQAQYYDQNNNSDYASTPFYNTQGHSPLTWQSSQNTHHSTRYVKKYGK